MESDKYGYLKVIGEKFGYKILVKSLIDSKGWIYYDRVNQKGEITPMKSPITSVASIEVSNGSSDTENQLSE